MADDDAPVWSGWSAPTDNTGPFQAQYTEVKMPCPACRVPLWKTFEANTWRYWWHCTGCGANFAIYPSMADAYLDALRDENELPPDLRY